MSGLTPPQGAETPGVATTRQIGVVEVSQSPFTGNPVALTTTDPAWLQLQNQVQQLVAAQRLAQKNPRVIPGNFTQPQAGSGTTAALNLAQGLLQLAPTYTLGASASFTVPSIITTTTGGIFWAPDGTVHFLAARPPQQLGWAQVGLDGTVLNQLVITVPTGLGYFGGPDMTVDSAGRVHLLWNDTYDLWYARIVNDQVQGPWRLTTNGQDLWDTYGAGLPSTDATGYAALGAESSVNAPGPDAYNGLLNAGYTIAVDANDVVHIVAVTALNGWFGVWGLTFADPTEPGTPVPIFPVTQLNTISGDASVLQAVQPSGETFVAITYAQGLPPNDATQFLLGATLVNGQVTARVFGGTLSVDDAWEPLGLTPPLSGTGWLFGLNNDVPQLEAVPYSHGQIAYSARLVTGSGNLTYAIEETQDAAGRWWLLYQPRSGGTVTGSYVAWQWPGGTAQSLQLNNGSPAPAIMGFPHGQPAVLLLSQAYPFAAEIQQLTPGVMTTGTFVSPTTTLATAVSAVTAYVDRAVTVSTQLTAAVAAGATSLSVLSAHDLNAGDTLELDPGTSVGERVTISSVSGTTITLSAGTQHAHNAGGLVNRVDVLASVSLVAAGSAPSFSAMTWASTAPSSVAPGAWSDTYTYTQATAEPDLTLELQLSAGGSDVAGAVTVYQYGLVPGVG